MNGWRHLTLMAALLEQFGDAFYREVLRLRLAEGLKGQPCAGCWVWRAIPYVAC
ncbi:hypothetical protein RI528_00445 [Aeromonas veronii]